MPRIHAALFLAVLLVAGCAKSPRSVVAPVSSSSGSTLSLAPAGEGRFTATLRIAAPTGARIQYAIDPAETGEITWKDAPAGMLALRLERRDRPYLLLARTVGANGPSAPERFMFSEAIIYKTTQIETPRPTHQQPINVPAIFTVTWTQRVLDVPAIAAGPTFLTRNVLASDIRPGDPNQITPIMVRQFFQDDLANHRGDWTTTTAMSTTIEDQDFTVLKYFTVVALDASGAPEPVDTLFNLDANVLSYRSTQENLAPRLHVESPLFNVTRTAASLDPTPLREVTIRAGNTLAVNWFGIPIVGRDVNGYRWALDLASVSDESARKNAKDLAHWSDWSLLATGATLGPFPAGDANKPPHVLYVEVRDNLGEINLVAVSIAVSGKPRGQAPLLLIDDQYGTPSELNASGLVPYRGAYPMEAEQDSFYNAVGGVPDSLRILGVPGSDPSAISRAGAFAGFPYDTLDYRFWPEAIPFETLVKYRAVAWYSDPSSAVRSGNKFSTTPATALRLINSAQQVNALAEYVAAGGKLWLFGIGATAAIANGYWSRIGGGTARIPYTTGETRDDILKPGNFLYDFVHLRATLWTAGVASAPTLTLPLQLHGCIPYLPQFAGDASQADRSHDPRIGPSAARTAVHWDDLPRLSIAAYRTANQDPALRSLALSFFIADPLVLTAGSGRSIESTADTLYLCQARTYDLTGAGPGASDGKPNAIWYHGGDQGDVVWFGFPLEFFELDQVRQVVGAVMRNFGIEPLPGGVKEGPGAATPPSGEATPVAQSMR